MISWSACKCPNATWVAWPTLFKNERRKSGISSSAPSQAFLATWTAWLKDNYEILDDSNPTKFKVVCPNTAEHSTSKEEDTIIFTGADGSTPNFYCAHAHCTGEEGTNQTETKKILYAFTELDQIVLKDSTTSFQGEIDRLYEKLIASGEFYVRGTAYPFEIIHWTNQKSQPLPLTPETFNYLMGSAQIKFSRLKRYKKATVLIPTLVQKEETKAILSLLHPEKLPLARSIIRTPILVKTKKGAEIIARQYCPELKTIVLGNPEQIESLQMELGEAKEVLTELTSLWKWSEKIDLARGVAELFTPALLAGGFIARPVPAFLVTADQPDAGKTFWHKAVGWIHGEEIDSHTFSGKTSISGLEEQLNLALSRGNNFFFIDELDGKIKSPLVNALLTGADEKEVRNPYGRFARVSVDQFIILLAGIRGFVVDEQLATRVVPIRIERPQNSGTYQWAKGNGELVSKWIKDNSTRLLAAVYSAIKKWVALGEPVSNPDSRFPSWSIGVNGVLENVLDLPRVTFELGADQRELTNTLGSWLDDQAFPELAHLVWAPGKTPYALSLSELRNTLVNSGLGIPGGDSYGLRDRDLENVQLRLLAAGLQHLPIARAPDEKGNAVYKAGKNFIVRYRCGNKRNGKPKYSYLLSQCNAIPVDPKEYIEVDE